MNGDGTADVVHCENASAVTMLSNRDGTFGAFTRTSFPGQSAINGNCSLGDFNGNAILDLIKIENASVQVFLNNSLFPDLLTSLTLGLSATTTLTYKPITDGSIYIKDTGTLASTYPVVDIQEAQYVVSTATVSDGNGGVLTNNYNYGGLKAHLTGRGSLGFRYQKVTQVDPDLTSTTFFRQDYPYIGLPSQIEKRITSSNTLIGASQLTYANSPVTTGSAVSQFPYLSQSVEQNFELSGTLINSTTSTNQYDTYGNATQIGVNSGDGYIKTTTNVYSNDTTNWFLGRLLKSTVTSSTP